MNSSSAQKLPDEVKQLLGDFAEALERKAAMEWLENVGNLNGNVEILNILEREMVKLCFKRLETCKRPTLDTLLAMTRGMAGLEPQRICKEIFQQKGVAPIAAGLNQLDLQIVCLKILSTHQGFFIGGDVTVKQGAIEACIIIVRDSVDEAAARAARLLEMLLFPNPRPVQLIPVGQVLLTRLSLEARESNDTFKSIASFALKVFQVLAKFPGFVLSSAFQSDVETVCNILEDTLDSSNSYQTIYIVTSLLCTLETGHDVDCSVVIEPLVTFLSNISNEDWNRAIPLVKKIIDLFLAARSSTVKYPSVIPVITQILLHLESQQCDLQWRCFKLLSIALSTVQGQALPMGTTPMSLDEVQMVKQRANMDAWKRMDNLLLRTVYERLFEIFMSHHAYRVDTIPMESLSIASQESDSTVVNPDKDLQEATHWIKVLWDVILHDKDCRLQLLEFGLLQTLLNNAIELMKQPDYRRIMKTFFLLEIMLQDVRSRAYLRRERKSGGLSLGAEWVLTVLDNQPHLDFVKHFLPLLENELRYDDQLWIELSKVKKDGSSFTTWIISNLENGNVQVWSLLLEQVTKFYPPSRVIVVEMLDQVDYIWNFSELRPGLKTLYKFLLDSVDLEYWLSQGDVFFLALLRTGIYVSLEKIKEDSQVLQVAKAVLTSQHVDTLISSVGKYPRALPAFVQLGWNQENIVLRPFGKVRLEVVTGVFGSTVSQPSKHHSFQPGFIGLKGEDGEIVYCNPGLLVQNSEIIQRMLQGSFSEAGKDVVELFEISSNGIKDLVTWLEGGVLQDVVDKAADKATLERALELMMIGDRFDIATLQQEALLWIQNQLDWTFTSGDWQQEELFAENAMTIFQFLQDFQYHLDTNSNWKLLESYCMTSILRHSDKISIRDFSPSIQLHLSNLVKKSISLQ